MKKTIFIISMSIIMLLVLTGCNSGNKSKENSKNEQVELVVWGDADNQAMFEGAFTKINDIFEKNNPEIKINYQFSGTLDSINVALQSDSLSDLFWVQGNKSSKMAEMVKGGYLLPIDDLSYERFPQESIDYATVDGKVYCSLPCFISYVTFYYNKDIFEKNNVTVPENWEDFEKIVNKFSKRGITPIALGGNGDFDRYWYIQASASSLASEDIDSIVAARQNGNFKKLEEVFTNFQEFSKNNSFGKDFISTDGTGAKLLFTNGNAAMIPDGTWNSQSFFESGLNIGTFSLPGKDGKKYAQTGPSNINTYAISSKTKYPKEARKYIEFLNSKEAQQIIEDETGEVPMLEDIKPRDKEVAELAKFDLVGANIYNKFSQIATETSKPQDLLLTTLLPNLIQEKITPEEAILQLKEELAK